MNRLFVWVCPHCRKTQEAPGKSVIATLKHEQSLFVCSSCGEAVGKSDISDWDIVERGETSELAKKTRLHRRRKP